MWASELTCVIDPTVLQSEGISLQASSCSEELQCCQSEILELRCTVNALEVERQAQHQLVWVLLHPQGTANAPATAWSQHI